MKTYPKFIVFVLFIFFISPMAGARQTDLTYRLKWKFNTSVAGVIYAKAHGYFHEAGLNVTVKEGGPEKDAINELELGHIDFGVASADQVIRALDKGADIVVLAQLFHVNPMQWIYRADQPEISMLTDLRGRKIAVTFGKNDEIIMNTLFAMAKIKKEEVRISGAGFDFTPFLTRKVDVWPVYRNSQGVILKDKLAREGEAVYFFNPSDFGVNFVANSVITSQEIWKSKPQVVGKFVRALLRGWEDAMAHENESTVLAAVKNKDKGTNDDIRRQQLVATRALIKPVSTLRIGTINKKAWEQTEAILLKENQIKKSVNIVQRLRQVK